jgi:hypothetical protein
VLLRKTNTEGWQKSNEGRCWEPRRGHKLQENPNEEKWTEEKDLGPEQNRNGPATHKKKETGWQKQGRRKINSVPLVTGRKALRTSGQIRIDRLLAVDSNKTKPERLTRGWPPEAVTGEQINRHQVNRKYEQTQQLDAHERNLTENKFFRKNNFNSNHKKTEVGRGGGKISDQQRRHTNARTA